MSIQKIRRRGGNIKNKENEQKNKNESNTAESLAAKNAKDAENVTPGDEEQVDEDENNKDNALSKVKLSSSMKKNIAIFKKLFENDDTARFREFENSKDSSFKFCIMFFDGLVNNLLVNESIIKPLIELKIEQPSKQTDLLQIAMDRYVMANSMTKSCDVNEIVENVTYGETVLLAEGSSEVLILNSKGFSLRSISEPQAEKALYGPREGFCEGIMINLSLVRRRLRSHHLKMKFRSVGKTSKTAICIAYMDNIVKHYVVEEINRKLDELEVDGIMDSNYIAEFIGDNAASPFPTMGSSERPDTISGKLLEGRVAIFVDGTPMVLTVPYLFIENFQSSEDYYMDPYYSSIARIFRIISFFLTITIPSFFISLVSFHPEMLPTPLMLSIANERKILPLPAAIEIFCMLTIFDILRETGVRMPSSVGQALSIVGALVIGQAAVSAKLVSASTIIVVGVTGITSLLIPRLSSAMLLMRLFLLLMSSTMGMYGLVCGLTIIFIHILNLRSFGVEQFLSDCKSDFQTNKDINFRAPLLKMISRPSYLSKNKTRLKFKELNDRNNPNNSKPGRNSQEVSLNSN